MEFHSGREKRQKLDQLSLMINEQKMLQRLRLTDVKHADFVELGNKIGAFAINEVMEFFGGQKKHIPKAETFWSRLSRDIRDYEIRESFKGNNYKELAEIYNLNIRQIYRIVHGRR